MKLIKNGEILLYGRVGESFWPHFTEHEVVDALLHLSDKDEIVIRINSGGGDAFAGVAIHSLLKASDAKIKIYVDGIAASAASVIAMAADTIVMNDGSTMMIHEAAAATYGTVTEHRRSLNMLDSLGKSMAKVYSKRADADAAEIRKMMKAETWFTSDEAVEQGFADIADEETEAQTADIYDYRKYKNAPKSLIEMATANASLFDEEIPNKQSAEAETQSAPKKERKSPMSKPAKEVVSQEDAAPQAIDIEAVQKEAAQKAQARISQILASNEAENNPALAKHLAFNKDYSADECIEMLKISTPEATNEDKPKTDPNEAKPAAQRVEVGLEVMDDHDTADQDDKLTNPLAERAAQMYGGAQ